MGYWKENEKWRTVTKSNVSHLYLYTWIRVSCWFSLIINSIIMYFISSSERVLDEIFVRKDLFFGTICYHLLWDKDR